MSDSTETRVAITLDDIRNAPAFTSRRGRVKGSSPTEREVIAFVEGNEPFAGFRWTVSQYAAAKRGIVRLHNPDAEKYDAAAYAAALSALGLTATEIARDGDGNERVTTVALQRNEVSDEGSDD